MSLQVVEQSEKDLQHEIEETELQISKLQKEVKRQKLRLEEVQEHKYRFCEEEFEKLYGKTAAQVRKDYVTLLEKCSGSLGKGHTVRVPGYSLYKKHPASHMGLKEEHYNICKPTPLVIEAFATIGEEVWIDPEPHIEYWGN